VGANAMIEPVMIGNTASDYIIGERKM
jgi:hypothetical protein